MGIIAWVIVILAVLIAAELLAFNLWCRFNPQKSRYEIYPVWVYAMAYLLLVEIAASVLLIFIQIFISF